MDIKLTALCWDKGGEVEVPFTAFKFPGGELHLKIEVPKYGVEEYYIEANLLDSDHVIGLLLLNDAIRKIDNKVPVYLVIKYLAYARQDRVAVEGEPLSIAVMAKLINSCEFNEVWVTDPHSDVSTALLNNCHVVDQESCFEEASEFTAMDDMSEVVLAIPDAGAAKKAYSFARSKGIKHVIQGLKQRDVATGKISGTAITGWENIPGLEDRDILVTDDIADGCRTFIELAKLLRPLTKKKLILYVTHGIFSHPEGRKVVEDVFDEVICYNDIRAIRDNKEHLV